MFALSLYCAPLNGQLRVAQLRASPGISAPCLGPSPRSVAKTSNLQVRCAKPGMPFRGGVISCAHDLSCRVMSTTMEARGSADLRVLLLLETHVHIGLSTMLCRLQHAGKMATYHVCRSRASLSSVVRHSRVELHLHD
jgi:hypothetical protein